MGLPNVLSKATEPSGTDFTVPADLYITPVLLLCVTCQQPIKGVITTERWVRVEWISPDGECRECVRKAKEERDANGRFNGTTSDD